MAGTYLKPWSRQYRGLLIFLLDQSSSMQESITRNGQTYSNGQIATAALNNLIFTIIKSTPIDMQTGKRKNYCDILVLGYGDRVNSLLPRGQIRPTSLKDLAEAQAGYSTVEVERYDSSTNKVIKVQESQPYWITYEANSSYTQMAMALQEAGRAINSWLQADRTRNESFPPIVINITDGQQNGDGNPATEAAKIRSIVTNDGNALLFSCHLTTNARQSIAFPKDVGQIDTTVADADERQWARQLFAMSSPIPFTMIQKARASFGIQLNDNARGFLYNASPTELINFLRWGTQPATIERRWQAY